MSPPDRRRQQGREDWYVPEAVSQPLGARIVWDGGRTGRHVGEGWVRVYGDGQHYGYLDDTGTVRYSA